MKKVFKGFTPVKMCGLSPVASFYSRPPHAAKTVHAVSKTLLLLLWYALTFQEGNIDSFVVLVSGKFPCFLEIFILFILSQLITKDTCQKSETLFKRVD